MVCNWISLQFQQLWAPCMWLFPTAASLAWQGSDMPRVSYIEMLTEQNREDSEVQLAPVLASVFWYLDNKRPSFCNIRLTEQL